MYSLLGSVIIHFLYQQSLNRKIDTFKLCGITALFSVSLKINKHQNFTGLRQPITWVQENIYGLLDENLAGKQRLSSRNIMFLKGTWCFLKEWWNERGKGEAGQLHNDKANDKGPLDSGLMQLMANCSSLQHVASVTKKKRKSHVNTSNMYLIVFLNCILQFWWNTRFKHTYYFVVLWNSHHSPQPWNA